MSLISHEDHRRVSAAITAAEARTSGEIVAVVTSESAGHLWFAFLAGAVVALLVPWPLIYFTWIAVQWIYPRQLIVFGLVTIALFHRPLRFALLPRDILNRVAHRRAVEQFLAQNMHTTEGRTGVLIFVSVAERYAEIIADTGIHTRLPQSDWQAIVDRLTGEIGAGSPADAFIHAIEAVGAHLARHFPPGSDEKGALPDRLIVLD